MARLLYTVGDATDPIGDGPRIIAHVTNDRNTWGAGFVLAVSRRWPEPEAAYRGDVSYNQLGLVNVVSVGPDLYVANMCAQHGLPTWENPVALDYKALGSCLDFLCEKATYLGASIHAPRFGAGIAGGHWPTIEALIKQRLIVNRIDVTIYDLPKR